MTNADTIQTILDNTLTAIATATANPLPSYQIDGTSVDHAGYLASLWATIDKCRAQLSAEEPFEVVTRGAC